MNKKKKWYINKNDDIYVYVYIYIYVYIEYILYKIL